MQIFRGHKALPYKKYVLHQEDAHTPERADFMQNPKRRLFVGFISVIFISVMLTLVSSALEGRTVELNGKTYTAVNLTLNNEPILEKTAILINNTTYVPFRALCEQFYSNGVVTWDSKTRTAGFVSDVLTIEIPEKSNYIIANGRYIYRDTPVRIVNNSVYVPIRMLAKALSAEVEWEDETKSVNLVYKGEVIQSGDEYYNETDLLYLSKIINAESRYEPLRGKIAVGNVVLNRVKSDDFPDTVYDVIFDCRYNIVQFHPVGSPAMERTPSEESVIAAKICLDGYTVSSDIIYFCNIDLSTNMWIVQTRDLVFKIGNHSFFS